MTGECKHFERMFTNGGLGRILLCKRKLAWRAELPLWKRIITAPFADIECGCPLAFGKEQ